MNINFEGNHAALTCYLQGEIDHHSAAYFRTQLDEKIGILKPELITLDFSGITFMDSSGVGLCLGRYRLLHSMGGKLRLTGTKGSMRRVFLLSGLDKLMQID